jgi:hypothetical protein
LREEPEKSVHRLGLLPAGRSHPAGLLLGTEAGGGLDTR